MSKILVTGALGQIGSDLALELVRVHGKNGVVLTDVRTSGDGVEVASHFELLDVCDFKAVDDLVERHDVKMVFHLAALLSASGERNHRLCWDVNMNGLLNVLEVARRRGLDRVICPSSIAVFGSRTQKLDTPQEATLSPNTMYGVTKVSGEFLSDYYVGRFGLDVRGIRYPGLISYTAEAGGGTTDYAVEIFYHALQNGKYTSFLSRETVLPMMYMPDAVRALIELGNSDRSKMKHSAYNLSACSFSVGDIAEAIKGHIPNFAIDYVPDYRQNIADSWPSTIDDSCARRDWGWSHSYGLEEIVRDMIGNLSVKLGIGG